MSLRRSFMAMSPCNLRGPLGNACFRESVAQRWKDEMENGESRGCDGIRNSNGHPGICWVGIAPDTVRVDEAAAARKNSYEAQLALDEVAARLVDAETGQRGFLLTGDETYLEPYREAVKNLDQVLGQLKVLSADNPKQQKHLQELEPLIEKKLSELQTTIDVRRNQGFAAANQVVLAGHGKQWMDQIRVVLGQMSDEGKDLRRIRTQEMRQVLTSTSRLVVAGN